MSLYHTTHKPAAYPKKKYAPTGGMVVVANETEERALGPGWSDNDPSPKEQDAEQAEQAEQAPVEKPKKTKKG